MLISSVQYNETRRVNLHKKKTVRIIKLRYKDGR